MSLRLPFLFVSVALLPLAILTQAPFAKSVEPTNVAEDHASNRMSETPLDFSAPWEIVEDFTFPAEDHLNGFASGLRFGELAGAPLDFDFDRDSTKEETGAALFTLRALPDHAVYAEWLSKRLDEIIAQKQATAPEPPLVEFVLPEPEPSVAAVTRAIDVVPMYDVWVSLLRDQPRPKRANEFIPRIKRIFAEEGVPEELAWLSEVESMFDPRARNRIGARGLFQFMPGTALEQGLRLRPYDERTHPEKSARAAAMLLRRLHGVFDSWPLALAAYNAGESRVRRTLAAGDATTFAEIADALPAETRHYVPKVLATLAIREGMDPALLAAPRIADAN